MNRILLFFFLLFSACTQPHKQVIEESKSQDQTLEQQLKAAVMQFPDSLVLKENLIQYYREDTAYDKALAIVDGALQKDSINARLWDIKATLLFENADTLDAIHSFEKAISIFADPAYMIPLGTLYAQTKNPKALKLADILAGKGKTDTDKQALFIKGLFYTYSNDKLKAILFFDKCIELNYTFMDAYLEKALALYDLEKYAEALAVLNKAVTLQNSFSEGYYYRGRCLEKLKFQEEAIDSYQRALMYDPDYTEAKEALEKLGVKQQ